MRARDVLSSKASNTVHTISPDADVREALEALSSFNIGALVVSTDGSSALGIVSERDIVRAPLTSEFFTTKVAALMTSELLTCSLDDEVQALAATMTERHIRHLPVVEDGRLIGLLSIGDVVKHRIDQLQFERDQLSNYVTT